jgi:AraC-like DNA-binding protein
MNRDWTAQQIIDLYSEGYTDIEVCRAMGITRRQFEKMVATNPHFRDIVERGRDYAEAWNLEQSRLNLNNRDFSVPLFNARMQNLFNWSQKTDQNTKSLNINESVTREELIERLRSHIPELLGRATPALIESQKEVSDEDT